MHAIRYNLGGSYLLMNDLDSITAGYEELAAATANEGKGWQPIGTFTGSFDGHGHEIRDLFFYRIAVAPGQTDPASISNIVNGVTYPFLSWE